MSREELKLQALFRIAMFFAIMIVIGFVASDINILSSQWGINMFKINAETKEIIELCREARRLYPEYSNYIVEMKKNIHNICDITMYFINLLEENEKNAWQTSELML